MISILILAILFAFGLNYFIFDIWKEHRISLEKYYLQREAQFALNFIINGAKLFSDENNYRFKGMIGAHELDPIGEKGRKIIKTYMLDPNQIKFFSGCVQPYPLSDPNSLVLFKNSCDQNSSYDYIILPHELSDSNNDPYKVYIDCYNDPNENSLYTVVIKLTQKKYDRDITIQMQSSVIIRNTVEIDI